MLKLGYKLMSEEHGPTDLVKNAQLPEKAGFDFAAISVHFFPRLDEQGQFCIGVVRAGSDRADHLGLMTAVTCLIMRYHPAIVAQAAATLGLLSNDRFPHRRRCDNHG
jgi:alkanesulfonate monooxygenase SsuD/methylene tetrahydromethanopterin reductase-like flavin-dependent oxidoreductase (luciferase family)